MLTASLLMGLAAGCASAPEPASFAPPRQDAPSAPRAGEPGAEPAGELRDETAPVGSASTPPAAPPAELAEPSNLPKPGESYATQDWGVAAVVRTAEVPFVSDDDSVSSFVPMLFFEGDRWFLRGTSGGVRIGKWDDFELNALVRLRFLDLPFEDQDFLLGDTPDFGLQVHDELKFGWWEGELMSDRRGNLHANGRAGASIVEGGWVLTPALNVRYGSADFVSRYYALESLTGQRAQDGFIVSPEVSARYHLGSDVYLLGTLRYNIYGDEILGLDAIDQRGSYEALVGFGFFQDSASPQFAGKPRKREYSDGQPTDLVPNVRVAHGWGTPSDLGDIFSGEIESDEFDNQMTSVFYAYPLTDRLFGVPLQVFLSPGFAYHWDSEVQDSTVELVTKIHVYYTFHWPIRWRLGAAEGVSWIEEVTYLERIESEGRGDRPSRLMNYLDLTLDLNVGDLFGAEDLKGLWLGASIHHRSSIFESASQFGSSKGGSNYPSIYLQYDLF